MFQEKLEQYQKLNDERLEEKRVEKETKEQMISKIIEFFFAQIYLNDTLTS